MTVLRRLIGGCATSCERGRAVGQCQSFSRLESVPHVERLVPRLGVLQVGRDALVVAAAEHRLDDRGPEPLALSIVAHTDREQVVMRLGRVGFVDDGKQPERPEHPEAKTANQRRKRSDEVARRDVGVARRVPERGRLMLLGREHQRLGLMETGGDRPPEHRSQTRRVITEPAHPAVQRVVAERVGQRPRRRIASCWASSLIAGKPSLLVLVVCHRSGWPWLRC